MSISENTTGTDNDFATVNRQLRNRTIFFVASAVLALVAACSGGNTLLPNTIMLLSAATVVLTVHFREQRFCITSD